MTHLFTKLQARLAADSERGQGTIEYVLVMLAGAAVAVVLVKAKYFPSGDQRMRLTFGCFGNWILVVLPSAMVTSDMAIMRGGACGPFVWGLMRSPASRSIGAATSVIGGYCSPCNSNRRSRRGLSATDGGGGASRTARISLGGF